ncbi:Transposon Ty3-I Gag-Pol polyprotein [Labeo rohita]|uniref:ribonuclease H n=1 Tax=Labeo rohita TaxID=84645 RepID=A0ABQ8L7K4_LABRO|nr:Transposon Ty3-I Gag-Pol polyprotein [Labeo rohita]
MEALLEKLNISPETYHQRFRSTTVPAGESPTETYNRLKNLYKRWVRPEKHSKEEIGEAIILEQLLRVLPYDARTHLGERARAEQPGHKAAVCPARKAKLTGFCYVPREGDCDFDSMGEIDNLPADMILGRDLPVLYELLQPTIKDSEHFLATVDVSCPALTRAQARAGLQPLLDLDSSLLQGGTKGPKKSCSQRRLEKYLGTPASEASVEGLEVNGWKMPGNIAQLQREDDTLKPLFVKAECEKTSNLCNEELSSDEWCVEKSSAGHRYILVVSDYATRYPETFPLRSITTPKIIHALVQLFSRVGIPEEILTDQGTNFTSRLMGQLNKQLGITAIRTTPYHPQTDCLVERFNQTLKNMLWKFVADTGRDWDKWLPFVFFAYREVPQASTGFSPFELLYGWQVQGPLDLLKRSWEEKPASKMEEKGIVQYVLGMRDRLERYREQAKENLQEKQQARKRWYDQHARLRQFQPGQKVLLLLPTSTSKLLAKWQGPYTVVRKMGPVTYEVHHPDKGKTRQTYHVNLWKEWKVPPGKEPETSLLVRKVEVEEEEESEDAKRQPFVVSLTHLEDSKREELQHHLNIGLDGLSWPNTPSTFPYPSPSPYPFEPSTSEWSSPMVIVPQKDGSLRVCIDFRKLNAQSQFDAHPMPRADDLLEKIGKACYITTLDLCKGYWQVPLNPESRPYTAFRTPVGLFQFTVLPFGLHGAPATFQWLMESSKAVKTGLWRTWMTW